MPPPGKLCNLVPLRPPLTLQQSDRGIYLWLRHLLDGANLNHSVMWTCLRVWSVFYQVTTVDSFLCSCDWASLGRVARAGFQPCICSTSLVRREETFTIWWMVFMLHAAERNVLIFFSSFFVSSVRILLWSHPFHTPSFTASCDVAVSRWCLFKAPPRVSLVLGLVGWYLFYPMCPTSLFTYFWIFDAEHNAFHIVDIQVLELLFYTRLNSFKKLYFVSNIWPWYYLFICI